jgi:hypothetical protein
VYLEAIDSFAQVDVDKLGKDRAGVAPEDLVKILLDALLTQVHIVNKFKLASMYVVHPCLKISKHRRRIIALIYISLKVLIEKRHIRHILTSQLQESEHQILENLLIQVEPNLNQIFLIVLRQLDLRILLIMVIWWSLDHNDLLLLRYRH